MLNYIKKTYKSSLPSKYTYFSQRFISNIKNAVEDIDVVNEIATIEGFPVGSSTFQEYVSSMWQLAGRASRDRNFPVELKRSLTFGLQGCDFHSPTFLETVEEIQYKTEFNPACAPPIEMYPRPDVPKLPTFQVPAVSPHVLRACMDAQAKYPQFNQSFFRAMFSKHGRPTYSIAGLSKKGYYEQVKKLHANIVSPERQWGPDLYLAIMKLADTWGVEHTAIEFHVPYEKFLKLLNKNTSIGFIPVDFYEVLDTGVQKAIGLKKKDVIGPVIRIFQDWVDALERWIEEDCKVRCPTIIILDQEMIKFEILWHHDVVDNERMTPEQIDEAAQKVRLFYMQSVLTYMLSVTCFKPISDSVRYYRSAVGVKVERGGLQSIWDILSDKNLSPRQLEVIEKWKHKGVNLLDAQYGQGDWSKYDQTLLAIVLLFVTFMAKPFFVHTKDSGVSADAMKIMYDQFVASAVQKIMYVYAHGTRDTFGCMFSGAFITSIGDTVYQMVMEQLYFMELLKKYPDNELLADIIEVGLVVFFFYGDDHIGKWPRCMNEFKLDPKSDTLLRDFVSFCCVNFGMNYKEKEYKVYDNLYSSHYFESIDGVFVEDMSRAVWGPKFLKNAVSHTYVVEDGVDHYLWTLPYRITEDLACKILFTAKSSGNAKTSVMSLMSHARLCSGNLEAYSMIRAVYDEIAPVAGVLTIDDWDYYKNTCRGDSARKVISSGFFPPFEELVANQLDGYNTDGFEPKDFKGNVSPKSHLYERDGHGNEQLPTTNFLDDHVFVDGENFASRYADLSVLTQDSYVGDGYPTY